MVSPPGSSAGSASTVPSSSRVSAVEETSPQRRAPSVNTAVRRALRALLSPGTSRAVSTRNGPDWIAWCACLPGSGSVERRSVMRLPVAAGVGGNFVASKLITATFLPNQSYSFTLTATTTAELSLLSGLNVMFSTVENGTPTTVYSASGGTGLLGIANVLNLFNGTTTATFNFMTPAAVAAGSPITVTISGGLTAAALANDTFTLSGATLNAVPEPGTVGAMGVGIVGLALAHFRRRLARN